MPVILFLVLGKYAIGGNQIQVIIDFLRAISEAMFIVVNYVILIVHIGVCSRIDVPIS